MAALYSKYRPKKFSEVVGQVAAVQTLRNASGLGKLSHAYLFTGSRGVGKTTLARILAKAANCTALVDGEPCLECYNCKAIGEGTFLDCIEIDAASHTGVDNIRNLIEGVSFRPSTGKVKVYIIDEVHMLSKGAFNALLKTLEEPPAHVLFILATTEIQKVPDTILSRTQRFDFGRLREKEIIAHLKNVLVSENREAEDSVLQVIATHASGSLRDSLTRLDKLLSVDGVITLQKVREILGVSDIGLVQELLTTISANPKSLPVFFENMRASSLDAGMFNRDLLEYLRILLDAAFDYRQETSWSEAENTKFQEHVSRFTVNDLIFLSRLFLKSFKEQSSSISQEIPLFLASCEAAVRFNQVGIQARPQPPAAPVIEKMTIKESPNVHTETTESVNEVKETVVIQKESQSIAPIEEQKLRLLWSQVIDAIKNQNSPLGTLVKNSPIVGVEDGIVWVGVKYLFHKEQLENAKTGQMLGKILEDVCAMQGRIMAKLIKAEVQNDNPAKALEDALQVFGGELVE